MARTFTLASATHKIDYGSPAVLDDLPASAGHLSVIVVGRLAAIPTAALTSLAGKSNGSNAGWSFALADVTGPNYAHPSMVVWTSLNRFHKTGGATQTGDTVQVGVDEIIATTFDGTQAGLKLFRNALKTPIAEVAAYTTVSTGSGTIGADAALNMYGWNDPGLSSAFGGDGAWVIVYNAVLTVAQLRTVQLGVLVCRAAAAEGDATWTRGINIMKSVAGYKLLGYVAGSGTATDYSGNGNNGTVTDAGATGAELGNVFSPTVFEDDCEPGNSANLQEQTLHRYTSGFARTRFSTISDSFTVWGNCTKSGSFPVAILGVFAIGGMYSSDGTYITEIATGAAGLFAGAVTGLGTASKIVSINNGPRSKGTGEPYQGTFMAAVIFDDTATDVTSAVRNKGLRVLSDSIMEGFNTVPVSRHCAMQRIRWDPPAAFDGVAQHCAGGLSLFDVAGDSTKRGVIVNLLVAGTTKPAAILIQLSGNDKFDALWTAANFGIGLGALIDALLTAFGGRIFVADAIISTLAGNPGEGNNTNGENYDLFRAQVKTVAEAKGKRVTFIPMKFAVKPDGIDSNDGLHPNNVGEWQMYNHYRILLTRPYETAPVSSAVHRQFRFG